MTACLSSPPARKAIHDRLARLLIVNGELDRLQRSGPPPDDLQALLAEAEATGPQAARSAPSADGLLSRCERLIVRYAADAQTMDEALRLSLARHLAEAIRLLQESERLAKAVYRRRSPALPPTPARRKVMFSIAIRSAPCGLPSAPSSSSLAAA